MILALLLNQNQMYITLICTAHSVCGSKQHHPAQRQQAASGFGSIDGTGSLSDDLVVCFSFFFKNTNTLKYLF